MKLISRNLKLFAAVVSAVAIVATTACVYAQEAVVADKAISAHKVENKTKRDSFCSSKNWSSERVNFREVRETAIPATGTVNVDGGQNGGISVKGDDRVDVLVRACIQTWGKSDESAKAVAGNIRINTSGTIKVENSVDAKDWSVSYQIIVPRSTNLNLKAHNGGISINGVDGSAQFETTNGGLNVVNAAGQFRGLTTNGGVNVVLSGNSWKGGGLDMLTTNGGVHLTMPAHYAAHIETGTINGGYRSDMPALDIDRTDPNERRRAMRISTTINGGGPPIKVVTTNGGVRINTPGTEKD